MSITVNTGTIHPPEFDIAEVFPCLRGKMMLFLQRRNCYEAEELADDSLFKAFVKPGPRNDVRNIEAYAMGILKNVYRGWSRKRIGLSQLPDDLAGSQGLGLDSGLHARQCLEGLSVEDRELLERYYIDGETAARLGQEHGLTAGGFRSLIFQLRLRLKERLKTDQRGGEKPTRRRKRIGCRSHTKMEASQHERDWGRTARDYPLPSRRRNERNGSSGN